MNSSKWSGVREPITFCTGGEARGEVGEGRGDKGEVGQGRGDKVEVGEGECKMMDEEEKDMRGEAR